MKIKKTIRKMANSLGYDIRKKGTIGDLHIEEAAKTIGPEVVHYMASTGQGTNECMEKGCLPVLAHFYQPIPDLKDLEERKVWDKVSELKGIEWKPKEYLKNLKELSVYADECDWPDDPTDDPMQFYTNNASFSYGCASALHSMIRKIKPKRVIEVGSGKSSLVIADAIKANKTDTEYTIIDPYSSIENTELFPKNTKLVLEQVENIDLSTFKKLSENDILFIDSSHVCKIGSDVNFEILEVLPSLKKGVYIHFHDIPLPYEYSKTYATAPGFRMFWTESYLLQAFLSNNDNFKIILPMAYIQKSHTEEFRKLFPKGDSATSWGSGSIWIKRVK